MYCLCACAKGQEIFFSGFSHGEVCVHWVSCWLQGWKFHNPTTRKLVISERADFNERYYPGLKEAHSSSPPSSLSLIPSSLLTSHQPSSVFIDHSAVSEDDQVTPAAHPGGEELIAGQPEPAGRIPDPPAVPAVPVVPAATTAPSIRPQDDQDFILPPAVHPPPPARSRRHNTPIPPASYSLPIGKCIRRPVHHGLPPPLAPAPAPVPRRPISTPFDSPSPSPSSGPSSPHPASSSSQPTRHSTRHNLGAPPGERWKIR